MGVCTGGTDRLGGTLGLWRMFYRSILTARVLYVEITSIFKLFSSKIVTVIAPDVVEVFSILLKEADQVSILTNGLSRQFEVVLAHVKAVNLL